MARKKRLERGSESVLGDASELAGDGIDEVRDEVGLFTADYGRWQRSRSEIPPPQFMSEALPEVARRR